MERDYKSAPQADDMGLKDVILGLASDLQELRSGTISTQDAIARANLAKQIYNGFRIHLQASKFLSEQAKLVDPESLPKPQSKEGAEHG